jgi:hypothetical protein
MKQEHKPAPRHHHVETPAARLAAMANEILVDIVTRIS